MDGTVLLEYRQHGSRVIDGARPGCHRSDLTGQPRYPQPLACAPQRERTKVDLRIIATVFAALFLAELGDKTQLAVISFVASGQPALAVFTGASLALVASTGMAVLGGQGLLRIVPAEVLQLIAAAIFVIVGVLVGWEAIGALRSN
jgi:putative Ca2+/H+ antiporter (TMEM165/GDT1 family)